ncbi:MAG: tRNA (adenosine(37)-N6)-threonylcarbamoyltransferase complex transferase subunit TsaD, partial [Patescibacteria group bacterium]
PPTSIEHEFNLLSNVVLSQIKIHRPFGGIVPNLAMREHQKNLVPILVTALRDAKMLQGRNVKIELSEETSLRAERYAVQQHKHSKFSARLNDAVGQAENYARSASNDSFVMKDKSLNLKLSAILSREQILLAELQKFVKKYDAPDIDAIAVTHGPGLEPALWVGINFAKALSTIWKKPIVPVNHLEGHIYAGFLPSKPTFKKYNFPPSKNIFPALALIVSGGHTELVLIKKHLNYKILGETRDDAAGEAFDKVAKMLKLDYPGGPAISKIAEYGNPTTINFPRPMLNSNDFDFSFSGLKTAVLYHLRLLGNRTPKLKADVAASFEQAVIDVLVSKTARALRKYKVKSLVVGGGVIANKKLRKSLEYMIKLFPETKLYLSPLWLSGDNAAMIAMAGYFHSLEKKKIPTYRRIKTLRAQGNLHL